jgi:geranylgeranyl diphosphate synthase type II
LELQEYKSIFLDYLSNEVIDDKEINKPVNLYDPIHYILQLGGKRLRPVLTLLSCEIFGGSYKPALNAALAIEMFHNFTLMHDDIMDKASLRRGKITVHKKWNINTGILSGDALMILAYQFFENYDGDIFKKIVTLFNKTALEVCEGQQFDIDFETKLNVSLAGYKKMIGYKTAVLIAASLKMGAIIGKAKDTEADLIYHFGFYLGMAFQLQDDYLDTFGGKDFGKKIGGDILENKKTFLVIKLLEIASKDDQFEIEKLLIVKDGGIDKIEKVTAYLKKYQIDIFIKEEIKEYTQKALTDCDKLKISEKDKESLVLFANNLMKRKL